MERCYYIDASHNSGTYENWYFIGNGKCIDVHYEYNNGENGEGHYSINEFEVTPDYMLDAPNECIISKEEFNEALRKAQLCVTKSTPQTKTN